MYIQDILEEHDKDGIPKVLKMLPVAINENQIAIGESSERYFFEIPFTNESPIALLSQVNALGLYVVDFDGTLYQTLIDKDTGSKIDTDAISGALSTVNIGLLRVLYYLIALKGITRDMPKRGMEKIEYLDLQEELVNTLVNNNIANIQDKPLDINITAIETGALGPSKIIMGSFMVFNRTINNKKSCSVNKEAIKNMFKITSNRIFTEEEKELMYQIPEYYTPSESVISLADKIHKSWARESHQRKRNILLEGPTGTGKTQDSKVLAALLGLPYTKVTCFSDMDSSDAIGAFYPKVSKAHKVEIPDDVIEFDPIGAYEELTGEIKEDVTAEEVKEYIFNLNNQADDNNNIPEYVYCESEIVKAFERGWLLEVQEPTCISDAAVLLILNSALEHDGVINLPDRTVKRHPDFICVFTTNRDYNGCRPLNQALRDRFNITKHMVLPSVEEIGERLQTISGCNDSAFCNSVADIFYDLNKHLDEIGINTQVSLRGMADFVMDMVDGYDKDDSLHEDIIYKITTDVDDVADIETFLENSTPYPRLEYIG